MGVGSGGRPRSPLDFHIVHFSVFFCYFSIFFPLPPFSGIFSADALRQIQNIMVCKNEKECHTNVEHIALLLY